MKRRSFVKAAGLSALSSISALHAVDDPANADVYEANGQGEPHAPPGSWSFILLPDTQYYSESYPDVFVSQTEWIVRQRAQRNIQFVLHLGDIVQSNTHPMWINASRAMDVLAKAKIPCLMASGNHDLGPWGSGADRRSFFSDYFIQSGGFKTGESENAYKRVTVGPAKFLLLSLEFGPRDSVVEWANEVVAKFPDHYAILVTHAYLYSDNTRYDWRAKGDAQHYSPHSYGIAKSSDGVNDGEALWQKLVRKHPQFVFTVNGHVTTGNGVAYLASKAEQGNTVHQILVNYQSGIVPERRNGGGGFLRIVEVAADGRTVNIQDYSPYYDEWLTDPDRRFTITLDRSVNEPFKA